MTDPTLHEQATRIFGEALERSDDTRAAFLNRRCGANGALRAYVDRLLTYDVEEPLAPAAAREVSRALSDEIPTSVGGYEIVERIGAGGMGVVYRARQASPARDVALKLLNDGALGRSGTERFVRESELLARLNHPGIARVIDAGVTTEVGATRRPFFVMELIHGETLDAYLHAHPTDTTGRIDLLLQICDAVEHAHQRGIIHRDLKPANVLVNEQGRAILVDFGIAKLSDRETGLTIAEDAGGGGRSLLGTIAYMSPEQLAGNIGEIDTRSDVYGLGVVAYEMLCGRLPYDIHGMSWSQAIASLERDEPRPLRARDRSLAADLEMIVMKAIRKAPAERYPSVSALADDLRRWREGRPVEARGAGTLYVVSKFARRHHVATICIAVALFAVIVALTLTSAALVRARRARAAALTEAERARAMSKFLEATVFGADPELGGASMTFLDAIAYTSSRIPNDLAAHPSLQADAHAMIGFVLRRHGRYSDAEPHLRRAYRLRSDALGEDHPSTGESMKALGELAFEYGGRADEAVSWLRRAADISRRSPGDPQRDCWTACSLGWALLDASRIDEAQEAFNASMAGVENAYDQLGKAYAGRPLRGLAACALHRGELDKALRMIDDAIVRQSTLSGMGQAFPLARAHLTRAGILIELGQAREAIAALDSGEALLGEIVEMAHPIRGEFSIERARLALASGMPAEARRHAEQSAALFEGSLAAHHWRRFEADALIALADSMHAPENLAVGAFDRANERLQTALGGQHPRTIWLYRTAADSYERHGHAERARFMRDVLKKRLETAGSN